MAEQGRSMLPAEALVPKNAPDRPTVPGDHTKRNIALAAGGGALALLMSAIFGGKEGVASVGEGMAEGVAFGLGERRKRQIEDEDRRSLSSYYQQRGEADVARARASLWGEENEAERLRQAEWAKKATQSDHDTNNRRLQSQADANLKKAARESVESTGVASDLLLDAENKAAIETFRLGRRKTQADINKAEREPKTKDEKAAEIKLLEKEMDALGLKKVVPAIGGYPPTDEYKAEIDRQIKAKNARLKELRGGPKGEGGGKADAPKTTGLTATETARLLELARRAAENGGVLNDAEADEFDRLKKKKFGR